MKNKKKFYIKDIFDIQSTGLDKKINVNEQLVPMVNFMDVYNQNKNIHSFSVTSGTPIAIEKNLVIDKDIIVTLSSEDHNDIFESLVIENPKNVKLVYSYHTSRLRIKIMFDPYYLDYYFKNNKWKNQMSRLACGSTRFVISKSDFSNATISIHNDVKIQQKIGSFLYLSINLLI